MREYGQIQCAFWSHADTQELSNDAKLLAVYLLTGPHSNGIGCYRVPDGYVMADLGWTKETVSKRFGELFRVGFAKRCETTDFVLIPKFLRWNKIANPNVASKRKEEIDAIPTKFTYFSDLVDALDSYGNHWGNGYINGLRNRWVNRTLPNPTQPNPRNISSRTDSAETPAEGEASGRGAVAPGCLAGNGKYQPKRYEIRQVYEFLNAKTGRTFRPEHPDGTLTQQGEWVRGLLKRGYEVQDFQIVIARKVNEWGDDDKMAKHLTPSTLFRPGNFSNYRGMSEATNAPE